MEVNRLQTLFQKLGCSSDFTPKHLDRVRRWKEVLLGLVYPPWCQVCACHPASPASGFVCDACARTVHWIRPPLCFRCGLPFDGAITQIFECSNCLDRSWAFESARAAVVAEGITLGIIHRYKYQEALWFEPFLAKLLVEAAAPTLHGAGWDYLVPVPLHPVRERERGFNQAERLARRLSVHCGIPLAPRLIDRAEFTPTQTRLSRDQRCQNVQEAFRPRPNIRLHGRNCVIIDDVLTTGATTNAVARTLQGMGGGNVMVWSVARAAFKPALIGEPGGDAPPQTA